MIYSMIFCKEL